MPCITGNGCARCYNMERVKSEHQIQVDWFNWLHYLSGLDQDVTDLIYAVPNGGARLPKEAIRLKAEGVKPGIPDVNIDIPSPRYHGMRIEFKKPGGKRSADQRRKHALLENEGYFVVTCDSVECAINALEEYCRDREES